MTNVPNIAALMAANASSAIMRMEQDNDLKKRIKDIQQYDQCENKNQVIKKQIYRNLLLTGGTKTMTLTEAETIKISRIQMNDYGDWEAYSDQEKLIFNNLEECVQHLVEYYKAKEIQVVPYKVTGNFVDVFMLLMKVDKK